MIVPEKLGTAAASRFTQVSPQSTEDDSNCCSVSYCALPLLYLALPQLYLCSTWLYLCPLLYLALPLLYRYLCSN